MEKIRLSKALAQAGVASRRAAEELIFEGHVTVNGEVAIEPQMRVDPSRDRIAVRGKSLPEAEDKVYFMLNKPAGYICSTKHNHPSKLILNLFKGVKKRLFTVGRLDQDTTGLILVTNDGDFANRVIHPSSNIAKEYLVKTQEEVTDEHLKAISQGALIEGSYVKPKRVTKVRKGTLKVVVTEGKKREVRILMDKAGLTVLELTRIRIGGLQLGSIPLGEYRSMTDADKDSIFE